MKIDWNQKQWLYGSLVLLTLGGMITMSCRKETPDTGAAQKASETLSSDIPTGAATSDTPMTTMTSDVSTGPVDSLCAPGTQCKNVDSNGKINPAGTSIAQCSGSYPDYVVPASLIPTGYTGPRFKLAQGFPASPPPPETYPWAKIDFRKGMAQANAYLYALRDYSFEGNVPVDFRVELNTVRHWYNMPLMNFGPGLREFIHGVTQERTLRGPELGLKPGVSVSNYAVGFYNAPGGYTMGRIWDAAGAPVLSASQFPEGTMVFKILFSAAQPTDFQDPAQDPLAGAPAWQVATSKGIISVRLMQMDVAARDSRAGTTGWVFGTFAFDRSAKDPIAWNRLRPVGLMWGNDPGYTPADQAAGKPFKEAFVSDQIPAYAKAHLGWAGRVNGPVDNPASACMSCHGTAQYAVDAPLIFPSSCKTDAQKLFWFRDFSGSTNFGFVDAKTCMPASMSPPAVALDFSLQAQVAVQNVLQFHDVNPCAAPQESPAFKTMTKVRESDAPRVSRDGFFAKPGQ